jgi:hypothetical protein
MTRNQAAAADARRRQIRLAQVAFAGAATATLVLFGAATSASASPQVPRAAPILGDHGGFATNDDGADSTFVNDNGQTSGDIFQQNAQDQN